MLLVECSTYIEWLLSPRDAVVPRHLHLVHWRVTLVKGKHWKLLVLAGDLQYACLVYLLAKGPCQGLQGGQVLDLQVVCGDVAVLDGLAVELIEEVLEDVVDSNTGEEVALFDGPV